MTRRVTVRETFGLDPWGPALRAFKQALAGDDHRPKPQWGLTSVRIFKPRISLNTWLRRARADRAVPIYNYFNRVTQPSEQGYSVEVTYARDYRGGRWTYDGHVGTDFACPVGTPLVTIAPGEVLRVANDMIRGGLKACIDHGHGLFSTFSHMSRVNVEPGDEVRRGDVIGLSGASGIEFVLFFPWVAPHLHLNVWLDGTPVDPFAASGETSLWIGGDEPRPASQDSLQDPVERSRFDHDAVEASIAGCTDPALVSRMRAIADPRQRAGEVLVQRVFAPWCFSAQPPLYVDRNQRAPRLDLPFRPEDYSGVAHAPRAR